MEPKWHELIDRVKNFHGDYEKWQAQAYQNDRYFFDLYIIKENILLAINSFKEYSRKQLLHRILSETYDLIQRECPIFSILCDNPSLRENVYNAIFFEMLCIFTHSSKRIAGMSLGKFMRKNSPQYYDARDTNNGGDAQPLDECSFSEIEKLRKDRHRVLSNRPVYVKRPEWSAMPISSEHEWKFYYKLDSLDNDPDRLDDTLRDTFKRIKNLYKGIIKTSYPIDRTSIEYEKFLSKLRKIKYENFLHLHKAILDHICEDSTYYGINLCRFERISGFFKITNEVNQLLNYKNEEDQKRFLRKTILLNGIHFSKVYHDFATLDDELCIANAASLFSGFSQQVVISSHLIVDELVENGAFGEDWESFFFDTINSMTEQVFYLPSQINYTIGAESQMCFEEVRAAPVHGLAFYS